MKHFLFTDQDQLCNLETTKSFYKNLITESFYLKLENPIESKAKFCVYAKH